ncbi:hypothetical protein [Vallicoccus soli]|uniref:hypothetical protein n=1 Tax=Vallicoccus soli TaxID=2339232 RepID=UPI00140386D9|nr:hypothetical protein [Vallicoccus soli]
MARWQVQATYEVPEGARVGRVPGLLAGGTRRGRAVVVVRVGARSVDEALVRVDARLGLASGAPVRRVGTHVRRVRRLALRRARPLVLSWGDGDDGSAGVREPRRPPGGPPSLRASA